MGRSYGSLRNDEQEQLCKRMMILAPQPAATAISCIWRFHCPSPIDKLANVVSDLSVWL
ncbi:hypothetical protein BJY04DRAFT_187687 [Aspergillus karnatakaensis]|uniref:uncharacterized protein n=1 Tax=Aspergillus karnatakaensis TaxID=1810916 RepID=UPI003CCDC09D